jgi:hypothetical protein
MVLASGFGPLGRGAGVSPVVGQECPRDVGPVAGERDDCLAAQGRSTAG